MKKICVVAILSLAFFSINTNAFSEGRKEDIKKDLDSAINILSQYVEDNRSLSNIFTEFLLHAKAAGSPLLASLCEKAQGNIARKQSLAMDCRKELESLSISIRNCPDSDCSEIISSGYEKMQEVDEYLEKEVKPLDEELIFIKKEVMYLLTRFIFYLSPFEQ